MQIGIPREAHNRGLHLQLRRSGDVDVQPDSIQKRIGLRQCGGLRAPLEISSKVKARRHSKLGDSDIARQRGRGRSAHEMQLGIGRGTDPRRVAQTYVLSLHGEVKFDLAIVGAGVSAERKQPAAGARGKSFDLKTILIKYQRSVDLVQCARQIGISDGTVGNL